MTMDRELMRGILLATLLCGAVSAANAQTVPDSLRAGIAAYDNAFDDDEFTQGITMIRAGMNPAGGSFDADWTSGLHRMIEYLLDRNESSLAETWARWAFRQQPDLQIDQAFPRRVVSTLNAGRERAEGEGAQDDRVGTDWEWSGLSAVDAVGTVLVISPMDQPLQVLIVGQGLVSDSESRALVPGSYSFEATAPGYDTLRVEREVLPGVTTLLTFRLLDLIPGLLYVASSPWGRVILDGTSIGYTHVAAFPVNAGTHHVRVEREAYVPFDTTITVTRDQRVRLGPIYLQPVRR